MTWGGGGAACFSQVNNQSIIQSVSQESILANARSFLEALMKSQVNVN